MTSTIRLRLVAFVFAALAGFAAAPAMAQKQGGSLTVGLELDIPGLDGWNRRTNHNGDDAFSGERRGESKQVVRNGGRAQIASAACTN